MALMTVIILTLTGTHIYAQEDIVYDDPTGYFSVSLTSDWQLATQGVGYATYQYQQANSFITFATIPLSEAVQTTKQGMEVAVSQLGMTIKSQTGGAGQGAWDLFIFDTHDGQFVSGAATIKLDVVIVMLYTGDNADTPPLYVYDVLNSITFSDVVAQSLPDSPEAFSAYVEELVKRDNVTLSVAVSYDGIVIYQAGFGSLDGLGSQVADANTVYKWGSSTKMVTAVALMQLWEQDLVQLDAPIADYLPYFPAEFPITVRHLLTHTSGLPEAPNVVRYVSLNDGEQLNPADVARDYVSSLTELIHEPGAENHYVNYNFLLLGEIVHEITGTPYVDYVRQNILTPLGMTHTDFIHTPEMLNNMAMPSDGRGADAMAYLSDNVDESVLNQLVARVDGDVLWFNPFNVLPAWGGLQGSVIDQSRFLNMIVKGGELDGVRILGAETIAMMQEVQIGTAESGFGLAWWLKNLSGYPAIGHAGGGPGISMDMQIFPAQKIAITVMTNRTGYNASAIIEMALNVTLSLLPG